MAQDSSPGDSLAEDLQNMRLLRELAVRMVTCDDIREVAGELLDAAVQITGADAGTVQILDERSGTLSIIAHRGISPHMLERFRRVSVDSGSSCGRAMLTQTRSVMHFDVTTMSDPDGVVSCHLNDGLRSAQSTPLIARSGRLIGMFSTHWRTHCQPNERQLGLLDLLAGQAADLLAHRQTEDALRESEARLAQEVNDSRELQEISRCLLEEGEGRGLYQVILDAAVRIARADFGCLQRLNENEAQLELLAAAGFDQTVMKAWSLVDANACAAGARSLATEHRFTAPDIAACELMRGTATADFYAAVGIHAVQYTPLVSRRRRIVGLLATHWKESRESAERELRLLDIVARQAADLIERQQAEEELKKSEVDYHTLFNSIDEGFCIIEVIFNDEGRAVDYVFLKMNPAFERHTGLKDVLGKRMRELAPMHEEHWFKIYGEVALSGEPVRFERPASQLGDRWFDVYAFRVGDAEQRHVAIVFNDITERTKALGQLQQAHDKLEERVEERTAELKMRAGQLRSLAAELTLSEQRERARMAAMLHDHVQQLLVSAKMRCEGLRRSGDQKQKADLNEVVGLLGECLSGLRSLTVELSPPILGEGLAPALDWLAGVWMKDKHELTVRCDLDWSVDAADEDVRNLVRIAVRELLFNVVKHSGEKVAELELAAEGSDQLRVKVRDSGRGFDPKEISAVKRGGTGLGLFTIRERIGLLGGKLEIRGFPGKGVETVIIMPRKVNLTAEVESLLAEP